jgi:hypothetical protein
MMIDSAASTVGHTNGYFPYRMAFAGGWIDQPFISKLNPSPPGSMVVVGIEPTYQFMERAGLATGTRRVALRLWNGRLPNRDPADLTKELYAAENDNLKDPSGSQDMIGLIYPGINRLDFDFNHEGGIFPKHIESNNDPAIAKWLAGVIYMLPVAPRPAGYNPLGVKNFDPKWIDRLGRSGKNCYDAILKKDINALGASMNECMLCWETILPQTVVHSLINIDLLDILRKYQAQYPGAMYSGCGGGYLYIVSEKPIPNALKVTVRIA